MFNMEDILARLQNGEDAGDIAEQFTNALNEANGKYLKQQDEAAKVKANEVIVKEEKIEAMTEILDLIHDYILEFYCEDTEDMNQLEEIFEDITPEEIVDFVDEMSIGIVKLIDLMNTFGNFNKKNDLANKKHMKKLDFNPDDIIGDFIKRFGW